MTQSVILKATATLDVEWTRQKGLELADAFDGIARLIPGDFDDKASRAFRAICLSKPLWDWFASDILGNDQPLFFAGPDGANDPNVLLIAQESGLSPVEIARLLPWIVTVAKIAWQIFEAARNR
jgi:hypothetical protein